MTPRSFGTHDGSFHADEVSACALLLVFNLIDRDTVFRTRDPKVLDDCEYVCDVGGIYSPEIKRFDHHQNEYSGELSSAGMIWRYLLEEKIISQPIYDYLNRAVIIGVDAHDNGKVLQEEGVWTFSHIIANFVPLAQTASNKDLKKAFFEAVDFAMKHFRRLLDRYQYIQESQEKIKKIMEESTNVLIFDEPISWQENFFQLGGEDHPALFLIMPAHNQWKLRGIPPNLANRMDVRMPLPEKWAGLRGEELQEISGIEGAIFCHKGRFISIWKTKEDALKALDLVLRGAGAAK